MTNQEFINKFNQMSHLYIAERGYNGEELATLIYPLNTDDADNYVVAVSESKNRQLEVYADYKIENNIVKLIETYIKTPIKKR